MDRWTWRLAIANLVAQLAIIATGAGVRLTGSGLGCSQWPMCEPGEFTPRLHEAMSFHPYVEFGNRVLSVGVLVVSAALAWAVLRREPTASRPRGLRALGVAPLALVLVQAGVGGITVLVELHPAVVGGHMGLSLLLVGVSMYLLIRLRSLDVPPRWSVPPAIRITAWAAMAALAVSLVLGVIATGAGPHSGDAEAPYRWAMDPAHISRVHAIAVWVFLALLIACLLMLRAARDDEALTAWWWLAGATVLQGAIGYVQYFTGLPALLVGLHVVGSGLLVAAAVHAMMSLRTRGPELGEPTPQRAAPAPQAPAP